MSTATAIAQVVDDLRTKRVRAIRGDVDLLLLGLGRIGHPTVVDATLIYESIVAKDEPVYIYEDHPSIAPPWDNAAICYVNDHGNVIVMHSRPVEFTQGDQLWEPAQTVDWDRVRWCLDTMVWIGGRSRELEGHFPTAGPVHMWRFAIYEDGEPADLRWVHLMPDYPMEYWDMAHLTLLGTLNLLNCRNVGLVEPARPRAEARRLARTDSHVHVINVFPHGKSSRSNKESGSGVPLTSVRGHFSHYGACCSSHEPKGLLFGKLSGRFWVPQFARGTADLGESDHSYRLVPE